MATLKVTAPFTVQLDPPPPVDPTKPAPKGAREAEAPTTYVFPSAGTYDDVPAEVADHWYTQAFLEGYEAPEASIESPHTMVMTPKPEPPPTAKEAAAMMTDEQKAALRQQRAAETAAAHHPDPHKPNHKPAS
jgi:hypothetical protein